MSRFLKALHSGRVLLMDGAMGTELMRTGGQPQEGLEAWNLTRPDDVLAVHASYVAAGAEVLLTHTFQAQPARLARCGLSGRCDEVVRAAAALAQCAAGPDRFVLGDLGPWPEPDAAEVTTVLAAMNGVDGVLIETASDVVLLEAVVRGLAQLGWSSLPVLFSPTYWKRGKDYVSPPDRTPSELARRAVELGVAAIGVNCGRDIELDDAANILRVYRSETALPLFARPNAGTPHETETGLIFPRSPADFAAKLPALLDAGACMVGGCCGTTAQHIASMREWLQDDSGLGGVQQ